MGEVRSERRAVRSEIRRRVELLRGVGTTAEELSVRCVR